LTQLFIAKRFYIAIDKETKHSEIVPAGFAWIGQMQICRVDLWYRVYYIILGCDEIFNFFYIGF